MSVITTADEHLESAKAHVEGAIRDLSAILIERVWGSEDFNTTATNNFRNVFFGLLRYRDTLENRGGQEIKDVLNE